ncbi:hypothetical protein PSHT_15490 [Puccinia striiformis]|uniref:Uncharacterized protein n=1 Tax=Puccinia striiformis TaxID=27350 RepID=A0A2S4UEY0_9BASI|nr:hypothetical protein PSHT_15490 [Puccinia striiformis]
MFGVNGKCAFKWVGGVMCRRSSPHNLAGLQLTKLYFSITRVWVSELERNKINYDQVADPIGNLSEVVLFGSESSVVPARITHCSDLKTCLTCLFLIMAKSNVDRKPLGEMTWARQRHSEGTRDSPIIVASADKEMQVALAPNYPQGLEVAQANCAVKDRFCALHGIQRLISPQYQLTVSERDIIVDPVQNEWYTGAPIAAELIVEGPQNFGAHTTTRPVVRRLIKDHGG